MSPKDIVTFRQQNMAKFVWNAKIFNFQPIFEASYICKQSEIDLWGFYSALCELNN